MIGTVRIKYIVPAQVTRESLIDNAVRRAMRDLLIKPELVLTNRDMSRLFKEVMRWWVHDTTCPACTPNRYT